MAYDLRRHQDTITVLEEPFRMRGSIYLSSFFMVNFSTRTCLSGFSLIFLSLLGFRVGSSLFGILFVKPFFFVNLISMSMFRFWVVGLKWALSSLSPFWALYEGKGPPINPSRHLRKERSFLPLEWLLTEGRGRSSTAVAAVVAATARLHAAAATTATPYPGHEETIVATDAFAPPPPPPLRRHRRCYHRHA